MRTYLTLVVLSCLSPGPESIIVTIGQGQKTSTKVLEESDDGQCASVKGRECALILRRKGESKK